MFDEFRQDLRYALRQLVQAPAFSLIIMVTLALGIGGNTAIFSIINELMLRPLPFDQPENLLRIPMGSSYPDVTDLMQRSKMVERIGGIRPQFFDLTQGSEPERIQGALVSGEFFPVLRVSAARGRVIQPQDDKPGNEKIVLLGEAFWRTRFASDPQIVGKSLSLSGAPYRVIGVLPERFEVPSQEAQLYAPIRVESAQETEARGAHTMAAIVRSKPGFTVEQVRAELDSIYAAMEKQYPETNTGVRPQVQPWQSHLVRNSRSMMWMLLGAVTFVLLIAITNVSGLLLTRAASRGREIAIRRALGAGRARLVRQLLMESLLLSLVGGVLAVLIAPWFSEIILTLSPGTMLRMQPISMNLSVLFFTAGISIFAGFLFGLFPALHATRPDFNELLKEGARGSDGRSARRFRNGMVIAELALALVLLAGAGLLLRSFGLLLSVDPGFNPDRLLTMNITLPMERFMEVPRRTVFFDQVVEKISSLPGVESVGMNSELPLGTGNVFHNLSIEGVPAEPGKEPEIHSRSISPGYFKTMGIPILKGRAFSSSDNAKSQLVAIVNEAFVRQILKGADPIGKRVMWARSDEPLWMTIVGVTGNIRAFSLATDDEPALYAPYAQEQQFWKTWMNVVVKASVNPDTLIQPIRKEVARVDRTIPVADLQRMSLVINKSFADRRFYLLLLGAFASLALFLAALGIYGVISYSVNRSLRDLGVRIALGAKKQDILRMVLGHALRLTIIGLAFGLLASLALTRLVKNLLYGIGSSDPITFACVSLLLGIVALIAGYLPARRATSVDPIIALRYE